MISSKNIKKALSIVEKNIIIVLLVVVIFNLGITTISNLIFNPKGLEPDILFSTFINYIVLFGLAYMVSYGVGQSLTSVPYLVSLNCPKKLLSKIVIFQGIIRSFIVSLIIFFIIGIYGLNFENIYIFGISIESLSLNYIIGIIGILFLLEFFVFNLFSYLCLTGVVIGWQYVLSSIFFLVGSLFLLFKQIILLFVYGIGFNIFIGALIIINILLSYINYRYIKRFEYKY